MGGWGRLGAKKKGDWVDLCGEGGKSADTFRAVLCAFFGDGWFEEVVSGTSNQGGGGVSGRGFVVARVCASHACARRRVLDTLVG